jgi:cysteine protease IpaJ
MAHGAVIAAPAYPGHQTKKQYYANSCGAACLLCAALELGHTNFAAIGNCSAGTLANDHVSEARLYYVSSGAAAAGLPTVGLAKRGYSMPSNLIAAAQHIGFTNATVYMRSTLSKTLLKAFYASEVQACLNMANVNVVEGSNAKFSHRPALGQNEYKLVIVEPVMVCLHYVLHRPDGSYMDPASGNDMASMPSYYNRSGISIVLS